MLLWGDYMIWLRRLVALVLTAAFIVCVVILVLGLFGRFEQTALVAPGISAADAEALSAPFADLLAGRDDDLKKRFTNGVKLDGADAKFAAMRKAVPAGATAPLRLIRWSATYGSKGTDLRGIHEQKFPDRVVRVETEVFRPNANSPWRLINFYVKTELNEALAINTLSLANRSPFVIATVLGALVVPLLIWLTAVACLLMENVPGRWLWLPFILLGLTTLRVALTGAWNFQLLSFQLFGGSFVSAGSAFEPWVFGVSAPLGALLFWVARLRRKFAPDLARQSPQLEP